MEFLTPLVGLYAAAAAVPLLLLLYFLKLKRREALVSSTLLWKRAVRDLQVNAPFQRLRRNLLLLLQLLALVVVLLALAGPVLSLRRGPGQRYVLLIDRSASMNATDVEPTRLDAAKRQAKIFVESMRTGSALSWRDQSDHAMVIAFDQRAGVACSFTSDKRQLAARIDAIEPGDGVSKLGEAVVVARAFAQSSGGEASGTSGEKAARLVLFSDGRIADLEGIVLGDDELVYQRIGRSQDNVGITAMNARRSYEQPQEVEVFASLANFASEPVTRDVQLAIGPNVHAVRSVTVPGCETQTDADTFRPGQATLSFSLFHSEAGVLEVHQLGTDALACDDAAWSILDPPRRLSVLLVTQGNSVLESALKACPIARLDPCTPAGFDALDPAAFAARQKYDVVVLDNHVPGHLPPCRYLVFGAPPQGIDVNSPGEVENQLIVDWRSQHPVLQYVDMTNLFAARSHRLLLPRDAELLAEFNGSPALALLRRHGGTYLIAGFDILQSNWPFEPGFVLFCYNALSFLGAQVDHDQRHELAVGEPITIENVPRDAVVTVICPGGREVDVRPDPSGTVRFPGTYDVGVYTARASQGPPRFYAVNLLEPQESRIEPKDEIEFAGLPVAAQEQGVQQANVPLWPLLVLLALMLVCAEWFAYNLKSRI